MHARQTIFFQVIAMPLCFELREIETRNAAMTEDYTSIQSQIRILEASQVSPSLSTRDIEMTDLRDRMHQLEKDKEDGETLIMNLEQKLVQSKLELESALNLKSVED